MKIQQKMKTPQRINSQEELDKRIKDSKSKVLDCFVQLNFGLRSSKEISMSETGDCYMVYNAIDDSEETISHEDLMGTFIGEAISKGALYKY